MLTLHFYTELKISTRFCWKRYFCGKRNQMLLLSPPATPPPPTLPAPPPPRASLQCIWVRLVIRELAVCSCWWMIPVRILSVVSLFPSLSPSHSFFFLSRCYRNCYDATTAAAVPVAAAVIKPRVNSRQKSTVRISAISPSKIDYWNGSASRRSIMDKRIMPSQSHWIKRQLHEISDQEYHTTLESIVL